MHVYELRNKYDGCRYRIPWSASCRLSTPVLLYGLRELLGRLVAYLPLALSVPGISPGTRSLISVGRCYVFRLHTSNMTRLSTETRTPEPRKRLLESYGLGRPDLGFRLNPPCFSTAGGLPNLIPRDQYNKFRKTSSVYWYKMIVRSDKCAIMRKA